MVKPSPSMGFRCSAGGGSGFRPALAFSILTPHMELHMVGTANRRISKDGIALGLRSLFGGVGLLSLIHKVLRTERVAVSIARILFNSVLMSVFPSTLDIHHLAPASKIIEYQVDD